MEIYLLKRKLKKNKVVFNLLKALYKPVNCIKNLKLTFKEYKKFKEILKGYGKEDKIILYVGIPLHSNLGDQAQYYCIKKWAKENYSNYKILEYPDCLVNSKILSFNNYLKKNLITQDDIIFFQSGYRSSDIANFQGEKAHRKMAEHFSDNKILVFPQTINFKSSKELENSIDSYSKNKNVLLLARDKTSYETAKLYKNKIDLFPDIVTSLIGSSESNVNRSGIMCCMRRDAEKLYDKAEIDEMIEELKKKDSVEVTDTTIDVSYEKLKENFENLIQGKITEFSKYKLVITDRYHGTIFSLISNTPTIVINSTDHKLSSGVDWFRESSNFDSHIYFAKSLAEAQQIAFNILDSKFDYTKKLDTYFNDNYYKKLKNIFENI